MGTALDRVIAWLHRCLDAEREADLALAMHYPTRWHPFFRDVMTIADLYRLPDPAPDTRPCLALPRG